ncbi:MAG: folylpolyglutamate synthase [Pycnora praestabilis]|nr:MAG: folylpolyglutamate synthase [Pycnora praestabilis]
MIELGLARIGRLLQNTSFTWRAIHVAGTNGKGSICSYLSAMLYAGNIRCGRFTSPHLIDVWDGVCINEKTVAKSLFNEVWEQMKRRSAEELIGASEFELLTATAFEIFDREKVDIGVVEVGLGGRLDATNVLDAPLVTVIAKIGKDHQSFLGNSIEQIAVQKAGIMKPGVPCIIDGTNQPSVLRVIHSCAEEVKAGPLITVSEEDDAQEKRLWSILSQTNFEPHQQMNIRCAFKALQQALRQAHPALCAWNLISAVKHVSWPGRLQTLSIEQLTGRQGSILLDGAHNQQSAEALGSQVDRRIRPTSQIITWVLAASNGKDVKELLRPLVKTGDHVVAVEFGPVDGMPWVTPTPAETILRTVGGISKAGQRLDAHRNILEALTWATTTAREGPLVVAGSLYLVSDVLRLLRDSSTPSKSH